MAEQGCEGEAQALDEVHQNSRKSATNASRRRPRLMPNVVRAGTAAVPPPKVAAAGVMGSGMFYKCEYRKLDPAQLIKSI